MAQHLLPTGSCWCGRGGDTRHGSSCLPARGTVAGGPRLHEQGGVGTLGAQASTVAGPLKRCRAKVRPLRRAMVGQGTPFDGSQ